MLKIMPKERMGLSTIVIQRVEFVEANAVIACLRQYIPHTNTYITEKYEGKFNVIASTYEEWDQETISTMRHLATGVVHGIRYARRLAGEVLRE